MVERKRAGHGIASRLGRNIAERRKRLGWTQAKLGERLRVDTETVSRIERGPSLPSLPTLERIAGFLNATAAELLSESSIQPSEQAATIAAWLKQLSEKDRVFVVETIKGLCKHLG